MISEILMGVKDFKCTGGYSVDVDSVQDCTGDITVCMIRGKARLGYMLKFDINMRMRKDGVDDTGTSVSISCHELSEHDPTFPIDIKASGGVEKKDVEKAFWEMWGECKNNFHDRMLEL
eukprot:GHVO01002987.1.p2 GENE.GHVO01002987.1~~GHVO01002987.1.p2  ORF type:complete len:119 (-),score=25.72 GHVO01002987.1:120-476(-)